MCTFQVLIWKCTVGANMDILGANMEILGAILYILGTNIIR